MTPPTAITSFGTTLLDIEEAVEVKQASRKPSRSRVELSDGRTVDLDSEVRSRTRPHRPVGINKPLSLTIEHCYLGNYPGAGGKKPVLLTSTVKDESQFSGQPRAVNAVKESQRHKSALSFAAVDDGTRTVFYSPALSEQRFTYTVELTIDRFDNRLAKRLSQLMSMAGGLPVFSVGAQFALVAGSQVVEIAAGAIDAALDGRPYFQSSPEITFDIAGHQDTQATKLVLTRDENRVEIMQTLEFADDGFELVHMGTRNPYRGDFPYVVISIDGRAKPQLAEWRATAATSDQLTQFLNPQSGNTRYVEAISSGLKLFSDVQTTKKILRERSELKDLTKGSKEYKAKEAKITALKKQIQTREIKGIVT